jgi:opacity protein-like surface antigen
LTPGEAQEIKTETQEQVKKEIAQGKYSSLPQWVQTMKLKGDFRVRYQNEKRKGANLNLGATTERNRARYRLRVGAEVKANDQLKVNFGLASGSDGDPRSTNQTFQDTFAKKSLWIDYAYAEYTPLKWASLYVGRMKNPLWEPGDMLWDTDINPEGFASKLSFKLNPNLEAYMNDAVFILDEYANSSDPWMFVVQPGLKWKINDKFNLNFANAYSGFKQVKGATLDWTAASNTKNGRGGLWYGFSCINPSLELGVNEPFKFLNLTLPFGLDIPFSSVFAEYVNNLDSSKTGYLLGLKMGYDKVSDWKQWQAKYMFTMLETDAWPDVFPDSDRYGGRTGITGHEVILSFGLSKNWTLDLDYYLTNLTSAVSDVDASQKKEHLIQADLNYKF